MHSTYAHYVCTTIMHVAAEAMLGVMLKGGRSIDSGDADAS